MRYPVLPVLRSLRSDAVAEHRFHPTRRWRFDFALPGDRIGIEIDGGVWTGGRHTRGAGFIKDQEKTNAAAVLGWRVLRFVPADVGSGRLLLVVKQALAASG